MDINLELGKQNGRLLRSVIFAIVMFAISFFPFTALIEIISRISDGSDSAGNYSLITICITSMWDTVICLVALVFAFSSQVILV